MSDALSLLFKKELSWANHSPHSLRATWVIHTWFEQITLKKLGIRWKKIVFCLFVFDSFPLFMPNSELLQSLFTKEQPRVNHYPRSLQKRNREQKPKSKLPTLSVEWIGFKYVYPKIRTVHAVLVAISVMGEDDEHEIPLSTHLHFYSQSLYFTRSSTVQTARRQWTNPTKTGQ